MVLKHISLALLLLSASPILNTMENNPAPQPAANNEEVRTVQFKYMAQTPICSGLILMAMSDKDENIHQVICNPQIMTIVQIRSIKKEGLTGLRFDDNRDLIAIMGDQEEKIVWTVNN